MVIWSGLASTAGQVTGWWFGTVGTVLLEGGYLCLQLVDLGLLGSELLLLSSKVLLQKKVMDRQFQDVAH